MYAIMLPPLIDGTNPSPYTCSQKHRKAKGYRISFIKFSSFSCRLRISGIVPAIAAIKAVLDFKISYFRLLLTLRTKHIVRWNTIEDSPKAKPNRGAFLCNASIAFYPLRVVTISRISLKSAERTKF